MEAPRDARIQFGRGNYKLGPGVMTWSLSALDSCPGKSETCSAKLEGGTTRCYAMRGRMKAHQASYRENLKFSRKPGFGAWLIAEILRRKVKMLRVHVSGDFYSLAYTKAWLRAMRECCDTHFYLYSRSWRIPGYTELFAEMAKLPNVSVWFSVDRSTGYPPVIPENVRVAYLAVDDADSQAIDPRYTDLLFRDYPSRSSVLRSVQGRPVCPHENGKDNHVTCTDCGICTTPKARPERRAQIADGRIALTVL